MTLITIRYFPLIAFMLLLVGGCTDPEPPVANPSKVDKALFKSTSLADQAAEVDNGERNLDTRIAEVDEALRTDPSAKNYAKRGALLIFKHDLSEAVIALDKAIELAPQQAKYYYTRGIAHHELGKPELAIKDYSTAIERDPKYSEAYTNRGAEFYYQQRFDEAERDFRIAIGLSPEDHIAFSFLAELCWGRRERTMEDLVEAKHYATIACDLTDYENEEYVGFLDDIEFNFEGSPREVADLQGTWLITNAAIGGEEIPVAEYGATKLRINQRTMLWITPEDKPRNAFLITVDRTDQPMSIELEPTSTNHNIAAALGIYEIENDSLRLSLSPPGSQIMPSVFESEPGSRHVAITLRRSEP